MVESILVPTDGSEHAKQAVAFAADLAKRYGAKLVLLHVMTQLGNDRIPEDLRAYASAEHIELSERSVFESVAEQILRGAQVTAHEHGAPDVESLLEIGDPATTILQVAKTQAIDLIVMGSRGLGSLRGLLMGSVSQKVSQLCGCTCVTVK
jgi:nucleotide-binding universal stress UspA family protein